MASTMSISDDSPTASPSASVLPVKPPCEIPALTRALRSPQPASARADTLDAIRRHLPALDPAVSTQPIADAVAHVLRANPANLLLAHRAVAVLAHPALAGGPAVDRAIVAAMDRLSMSAAFQHTAMAALQNAAASSTPPVDRDVVILAVVSAMRTHRAQNGVLLRGADLIAYHLNQPTNPPLTSSFRLATRVIVDSIDNLSATPQGASTALLALVATVQHIMPLNSFGARPSTATRFSRGSSVANTVDQQFSAAVVLAMTRHRPYSPVQHLGCELIRVVAAGTSSLARHAARELFVAGATAAVVSSMHSHSNDVGIVDRGLLALRALLLGGGFHGRAVKPGLNVDFDCAEYVSTAIDRISDTISLKDRDLASAAAVLAMDVRAALLPANKDRFYNDTPGGTARIADLGKRIIRRIRFGQRQAYYEADFDDRFGEDSFADMYDHPHSHSSHHQPRNTKEVSQATRGRRVSGRSSFTIGQMSVNRRLDSDATAAAAEIARANRKLSDGAPLVDASATEPNGGPQIALNRRWRSVSGRWNQRGRRGSIVSTMEPPVPHTAPTVTKVPASSSSSSPPSDRRDRRGPLTLSGSEMANLTRQPSRVFGGVPPDGELFSSRRKDVRSREGRATFSATGHDDFAF